MEVFLQYKEIPPDLLEFFEPVTVDGRPDVFSVSTVPFKGAHFAVMAEKVVEPCVLSSTSEKGCCAKCGSPWERVKERTDAVNTSCKGNYLNKGKTAVHQENRAQEGKRYISQTVSWQPTCTCHGHFDTVTIPSEEKDMPDRKISVYKPHIPLEQHPVDRCIVLDAFAGACTTPLIALKFNRQFIAIELSPEYVKLGRKRIEFELKQLKMF